MVLTPIVSPDACFPCRIFRCGGRNQVGVSLLRRCFHCKWNSGPLTEELSFDISINPQMRSPANEAGSQPAAFHSTSGWPDRGKDWVREYPVSTWHDYRRSRYLTAVGDIRDSCSEHPYWRVWCGPVPRWLQGHLTFIVHGGINEHKVTIRNLFVLPVGEDADTWLRYHHCSVISFKPDEDERRMKRWSQSPWRTIAELEDWEQAFVLSKQAKLSRRWSPWLKKPAPPCAGGNCHIVGMDSGTPAGFGDHPSSFLSLEGAIWWVPGGQPSVGYWLRWLRIITDRKWNEI